MKESLAQFFMQIGLNNTNPQDLSFKHTKKHEIVQMNPL
jgi:hypothetical protein